MGVVNQGPVHRDPEWLREQYHDKGLTQTEVADLAGVSQPAVYQQLRKYGIETRGQGWSNKRYSDSDLLGDLRRVADELGGAPNTGDYKTHGEYSHSIYIVRWGTWRGALEAAGIPRRDQ